MSERAEAVSYPLPFEDPYFKDVDEHDTFFYQVQWLAKTGITSGVGDGNLFKPYDNITRGQMAVFLYKMAGSPSYTAPTTSRFSDVPTSHTFYKHISWLAASGITSGVGDGARFDPNAFVTRGQMAVFLYKFAGVPYYEAPRNALFADVSTQHAFYFHTSWLRDMTVTSGVGDGSNYAPNRSVTRAQMAVFLYKYDRDAPSARLEVTRSVDYRCTGRIAMTVRAGLEDWVAFEWTTWNAIDGTETHFVKQESDGNLYSLLFEVANETTVVFASGYYHNGSRFVAVPTYVSSNVCD